MRCDVIITSPWSDTPTPPTVDSDGVLWLRDGVKIMARCKLNCWLKQPTRLMCGLLIIAHYTSLACPLAAPWFSQPNHVIVFFLSTTFSQLSNKFFYSGLSLIDSAKNGNLSADLHLIDWFRGRVICQLHDWFNCFSILLCDWNFTFSFTITFNSPQ